MVFGKEQNRLWYTDSDLGLALWDRRKLHRGWAAGSVDCIRVAGSSVVAFMRLKKGAPFTVYSCTFENGRPRAEKLADCPGPTSFHTIATGGGGIFVGTGLGLFFLNLATPSATVLRPMESIGTMVSHHFGGANALMAPFGTQ